jgi:hypothetical protein
MSQQREPLTVANAWRFEPNSFLCHFNSRIRPPEASLDGLTMAAVCILKLCVRG